MSDSDARVELTTRVSSFDVACPGLMLTANASLVLGYLWTGWLTDTSGLAVSVIRGGVFPSVVAAAILVLRPQSLRRGLPGSRAILPAVAVLELALCSIADVTASQAIGFAAGSAAILTAAVCMISVLMRETGSRSDLSVEVAPAGPSAVRQDPEPAASDRPSLGRRLAFPIQVVRSMSSAGTEAA